MRASGWGASLSGWRSPSRQGAAMNYIDHFRQQFAACPLIAIIRGVQPEEAEDIGDALIEAGIRIIEVPLRSEEHTSELQSLMRISYAVFCLKKKTYYTTPESQSFIIQQLIALI